MTQQNRTKASRPPREALSAIVARRTARQLDGVLGSDTVTTTLDVALRAEAWLRSDLGRRRRRLWHSWNLPTASDVRRMTERVDIVDHQINELAIRLVDNAKPRTTRRR